jgi:tol-pal system protein YbgF
VLTLGFLARIGTIALAMVTSAACVMPDQVSQLQKDVADVQQQLTEMERDQKAAIERMEELAAEASREETPEAVVTRAEIADVQMRLDEIDRDRGILIERLGEANRRIDGLSQDIQENREIVRQIAVAGGAIAAVGEDGSLPPDRPALGGPSVVPSAEALYNAAYTDFSKGNYALAISGFEEYATRYPDSDQADNALYWVGECFFSQGNHEVAIEAYDRMLERYPASDRAASANLKKGLAYLEQNQIREAIVQLEYVQNQYPGTDEARIAAEKLTR